MHKSLTIALVIWVFILAVALSEAQGANSKLTADNKALHSDLQVYITLNEKQEDVIVQLERLKGVVVSEVTYYAPTGHNTYTGTAPREGETVAVDPNYIPLGSDVYIEGLGWRKAEDTGGAIDGTDLDVFVGSEEEANRGGRHHALVLVKENKNEN